MAAPVEKICDPDQFKLTQAITLAKTGAEVLPGYEIAIVRYLQSQCLSKSAAMATVFRGLEVLEGILGHSESDESRLMALLRPFLRSSDAAIISKCVLILGRRSNSVAWFATIMSENDFRIRANLIEALWGRNEPATIKLLKHGLDDPHQRVVANAAYGLFLVQDPAWLTGLQTLLESRHAVFRQSGIWLLKTTAPADARERVGKFIRDPDANVRRAAFNALAILPRRETPAEPLDHALAADIPAPAPPPAEGPVSETTAAAAPVEEPPAHLLRAPKLLLLDR
jgi:hypothetical protein